MGERLFTRRNAVLLWWVGFFCLVADLFYPVSMGWTRALGVALMGLLAAALLGLWWRYPFARWALLCLYAALAVFAVLPGSACYDRPALRQEVAQALQRYEGAPYVLGGENVIGIDCSGLVRRGIIDGTFLHGVGTLNPLLVRRAVLLWWNDVSARDMEMGARGNARKIAESKSLALLDDKNLHPGDFAVTRGGAHALAYLGEHIWIEADPDPSVWKVICINARTTKSEWFRQPVSILRWRLLEAPYRSGQKAN